MIYLKIITILFVSVAIIIALIYSFHEKTYRNGYQHGFENGYKAGKTIGKTIKCEKYSQNDIKEENLICLNDNIKR